MHHLLLLLPLAALVLFAYLPFRTALPLYLLILAGSLAAYWKALQAQRRVPATGRRAMIGDRAVVVRVGETEAEVEYHGEIWNAFSSGPLKQGDSVVIEAVEGLRLKVSPFVEPSSGQRKL